MKKKIFSTRKFKYGAAATVLTAFFIAAVILMNVVVSAIDSKYNLYFDLTDDHIFTVSDTTTELVNEQLKTYAENHGHEANIKITFLQARDLLVAEQMKNWVVTLAESYAERYSQIVVEFREDITTHPENYTYYTDLGYDINTDTILITNTHEKGAFRYLTFDSCLVYDEEGSKVWAFQGEMKFNAAILYVTDHKSPVVTFTTGHGEIVPQALREVLTNCGFTIEDVDLTSGDISDESKILFICNPQKDLTYSETDSVVTEYTKISDYLNAYRSMVVIASPGMPELPVLDELLAGWGMQVVRNQVVMDDTYCHTQDNQMLYVNYADTDTVADNLTSSLTDLSNPPRSLMIQSAPVNILFDGDGDTSIVRPVLVSSDNAYVEKVTQNGTETEKGPFNLMAISSRATYIDNVETYGHLLVIGSQHFTETNAFREQFGNTEIVFNIIRLLSDEHINVDVHYKVIEDYGIDIDQGTVYTYGIITVAVIPLVIFAFGTFVYIKRKHM